VEVGVGFDLSPLLLNLQPPFSRTFYPQLLAVSQLNSPAAWAGRKVRAARAIEGDNFLLEGRWPGRVIIWRPCGW